MRSWNESRERNECLYRRKRSKVKKGKGEIVWRKCDANSLAVKLITEIYRENLLISSPIA